MSRADRRSRLDFGVLPGQVTASREQAIESSWRWQSIPMPSHADLLALYMAVAAKAGSGDRARSSKFYD